MDWTEIEVEIIVHDYFEMLNLELKGISYNIKSSKKNSTSPK